MKRVASTARTNQNGQFAEIRKEMKNVTANLSTLNQLELFSFIQELPFLIRDIEEMRKEAERIMVLRYYQRLGEILSLVPDEIWGHVLSFFCDSGENKQLRRVACVSKSWSRLVDQILYDLLSSDPSKIRYPPLWMLMKFRNRNIQNLSLATHTKSALFKPYIFEHHLLQFTSLTSLDLTSNNTISVGCLEKLPNLTKLNLTSNRSIDTRSLERLTKLKKLILHENPFIEMKSLLALPLLEELSITHQNQFFKDKNSVYQFANLINLKTLKIIKPILNSDTRSSFNQLIRLDLWLPLALPKLINLRVFRLISDQSFNCAVLSSLRNLNSLTLTNNIRSTDLELKLLTNLTDLHIINCKNFTVHGIKCLTNLVSLRCIGVFPIFTDISYFLRDFSSLTNIEICTNVKVTRRHL